MKRHFSDALIRPVETPGEHEIRVGLLTGCVQDLIFQHVNRDTAERSRQRLRGRYAATQSVAARSTRTTANRNWPSNSPAGSSILSTSITRRHHHQRRRLRFASQAFRTACCRTIRLISRTREQWSAKVRDITNGSSRSTSARPRHAPQTRHLSRRLPSLPRPENHRLSRANSSSHSRARAGGAARIDLVLRQRGHLQPHPARDVANAPPTQDGKYRDNRSSGRSVGQPGLFSATADGRTRFEPETKNRPSDFTSGAGLSKRNFSTLRTCFWYFDRSEGGASCFHSPG